MLLRSRIRGCLIGAALGDAWGAPVEKLSPEEIRQQYGNIDSLDVEHYRYPSRTHGKGFGRFTDDTLMNILLCQVYQELGSHLDAYSVFPLIRKIYFEEIWVPEYQKKMPLIERLFYPEKYLFLSNFLASRDPRSGGVGNMVNCGAAMYMAPVGLANAADPLGAYQEAISFASAHQTSYGLEAAGVFAACVAAAMIEGISLEQIVQNALDLAKDGTKLAIAAVVDIVPKMRQAQDPASVLHQTLRPFSPMGDDLKRSPDKIGQPTENYTPSRLKSIEELPVALGYILLHKGDFMESLKGGVNSGRDTDSIGCMIGAILGAWHGVDAINPEYIQQLRQANGYDLIDIADQFANAVIHLHKQDSMRWKCVSKARFSLEQQGQSGECL